MQFQNNKEKILIVDFGSQVTKLIARRVSEIGVYSEIVNTKKVLKIKNFNNVKGIILSGGPSSVTKQKYQSIPKKYFFKKNIPILEFVMVYNLIAKLFGGKIKASKKRENLVEH